MILLCFDWNDLVRCDWTTGFLVLLYIVLYIYIYIVVDEIHCPVQVVFNTDVNSHSSVLRLCFATEDCDFIFVLKIIFFVADGIWLIFF